MKSRLIVLVAAAAIFGFWLFLFRHYSIDDAFITFRYAENLAQGFGLTFNPGGEAVEGYSNFLWLLVLSGCFKIGLPTYLAAKLLGVLATLTTGVLWYVHFRSDRRPLLWLVGPLYLATPFSALWAISGLELGLHALLVSALVLLTLRRSRWILAVAPLVVLSRPEGIAIVFTVMIASAFVGFRERSVSFWYIGGGVAAAAIAMAVLIVFRLEVFGYPLPNTYYAKTHYHSSGFGELLKMLLWLAPLSLAVIWAAAVSLFRRTTPPEVVLACAVFLAQAVISSSVDPVMNFFLRYLVSFLPFLILAAIWVATRIPLTTARHVFVTAVVMALLWPVVRIEQLSRENDAIVAAQDAVTKWFQGAPSTLTVSMSDLGRIPYYTHLTFNDLWGLADKDIGHRGFNGTYEFLHMPDYFLMVGYVDTAGVHLKFWREGRIFEQPLFDQCYEPVNVATPPGASVDSAGYYYLIFRRKPGAVALVKSYGQEFWERKMQTPDEPE